MISFRSKKTQKTNKKTLKNVMKTSGLWVPKFTLNCPSRTYGAVVGWEVLAQVRLHHVANSITSGGGIFGAPSVFQSNTNFFFITIGTRDEEIDIFNWSPGRRIICVTLDSWRNNFSRTSKYLLISPEAKQLPYEKENLIYSFNREPLD